MASTTAVQDSRRFDPSKHLTLVTGREYLEVKWRLAWLRSEHPHAILVTRLESHENNEAVFQARVKIPDGGEATGWGSETAKGFGDYLEKAETKAIGRALAALGFGTQSCTDFDYGDGQTRPPAQTQPARQAREIRASATNHSEPTQRQLDLIERLLGELEMAPGEYVREVERVVGAAPDMLTRRDASAMIERLNELKRHLALDTNRP